MTRKSEIKVVYDQCSEEFRNLTKIEWTADDSCGPLAGHELSGGVVVEIVATRGNNDGLAYGVGQWFHITTTHIWSCIDNGSDGDDWSRNNVRTGGAGAIGYRIPLDDGLAAEIQRLAAALAN